MGGKVGGFLAIGVYKGVGWEVQQKEFGAISSEIRGIL